MNEQTIWHVWFDEVMEHLKKESNNYLENTYKPLVKHPGKFILNHIILITLILESLKSFTKDEIINYWVIWWARGIAKCPWKRDLWHEFHQTQGLTGNKFIKDTMSRDRYQFNFNFNYKDGFLLIDASKVIWIGFKII